MALSNWLTRRRASTVGSSHRAPEAALEPLEPRLLLDGDPVGGLLEDGFVPQIASLEVSATEIDENESVALTGSFVDEDVGDTHFATIDWGDGSPAETIFFATGTREFSREHQYLDDDPTGTAADVYTISATVSDGAGSDTATVELTVNNVAPAITALSAEETGYDQGYVVALTGGFDDPGTLDEHSGTIDWGDGNSDPLALTVGERGFLASHTYASGGVFTIQATLADDDTGEDTSSTTVTLEHVVPVIDELSVEPSVIDENGTVTLTGSFVDPDASDEHTATIEWGDGSSDTLMLTVGERTFTASHHYLDDDPSGTSSDDYLIAVTVADAAGGDADSTTVTVNNVAPVIQELVSGYGGEGEEVALTGTFTDVGTLDEHAAEIDWGDGTTSSAVIDEVGGSGTLSGSHTYQSGGAYTIQVTLTDDDTGTAAATTAVAISGVFVRDGVLQIIGTSGKDRVKINRQGNGLLKVHASFLTCRRHHMTFDSEGIERIEVFLGDGSDRVQISGNIELPAILSGGAGNDHLKAGRGPTVLLGGEGNDRLIGHRGNDILIGGEGKDRLVGGPGDDILIGGSTLFDINGDALTEPLLAMLAEWGSDRDFDTRVANLEGTGTGPRLNDSYFLQDGVTVFDDDAKDRLTGGSGENWLFEPILPKSAIRHTHRWNNCRPDDIVVPPKHANGKRA